ncbi:MAG: macrolide ABC transporter ATP-binding protein [Candidatus Komeilibacteria bacterium CG_4_10_14_0_2_um_filter_37_10]|uniref:Macrolide ABC transporter ATP-binding protein n=1 Tax=Candidatus Komeilibacteria bacterium CG_4_10_14_0_2_um_filter_37_10 TaxID=1974470 RepID=A0A2M7VGA0_9BACT|nr:MAG: macrolide ABC transporter ATP-binding protein [Candidatus Komeilibacteria bacterium CG_4_10_14_0_2_um_filter_37_10]PJA92715.1 MAG: macrolide ABC transporter ATP-binding protein [Candidatus Komeilibacteria bacterium CG_4_9_14_3_um_filter_37_5]
MPNNIIVANKISKNYINDGVETDVLFAVDFQIQSGDYVAIMGPSGSGKSTLMHILGFLDRPTGGQYLFAGKDAVVLSDLELAELRNSQVGFVFQQFNLLPKTTVYENVRLPLLYGKKKNHDELTMAAIKAVGLEHRAQFLSNQLSGGEKQRVAIARAIVNQPQVIFADEPTGNLDSKNGAQIMNIFEDLNKAGKTIILVTHEQDTANHAQRIITLRDGQIISDSKVQNRVDGKSDFLRK